MKIAIFSLSLSLLFFITLTRFGTLKRLEVRIPAIYRVPEPLLDFYRCYRTYTRYRLYRGTLSRYISPECRYLSPYQVEVSICAFQRILPGISCSLHSFLATLRTDPYFRSRFSIVDIERQTERSI